MAGRIIEITGSGDFTGGPTAIDGKGLAVVLDAADQSEAYALAEDFFPPWVADIPRGSIQVTEKGGGVFQIDVAYKNAVPNQANPSAGNPPSNSRPSSPSKPNETALTRDMTFTTGGGTRKRMYSILTRHALSADPAETAPDFGKLIGVTKEGKIEGCEVIAPAADFTITKRFVSLTVGWFRTMLDTVATTNDADWLGMLRGEVLFKGSDGNYKDGDPAPWTVTAKFGYSRNYAEGDSAAVADMLKVGDIQIPDLYGWEHVWVSYATKKVDFDTGTGTIKVPIEYPRWAYVEQVYLEMPFSSLGFDV